MDEVWIRVALILAAIGLVLVVASVRHRSVRSPRPVRAESMQAGVYLFASSTCETCDRAREKLDRGIGEDGYTELVWEQDPGPFGELGVEAVPSVVVLGNDGTGRLFPGQPERALRAIRRR